MNSIKVILTDDHQLVRDGIRSLLKDAKNIEVIDEASDGYELLDKLTVLKPEIIIIDVSMPRLSGIEAIKRITESYPSIKVLVLSMFTSEEYIFNAIKAGAKGYLPKNTSKKELLEAIYSINAGNEYFSDSISNIILKSYIKKAKANDDYSGNKQNVLSSRELEILTLFAEGNTNQEIADKLFISIRTVESHKNHIMQKLELKTLVDLVKFAIKNNIIQL
jgi:DNA-binding NarL/FixJ family response regulator